MQRFKHISSMGYCLGLKLVALSLLLSLPLISCINEDFPEDNPVNPKPEPGTYSSIDLPCYIGVSITPTGTTSTRASEDNGFYDGDTNEYAIASGEGHHYLIIYDPDPSEDAKPLAIMPLIINPNEGSTNNTPTNITLIVKKILSTGDFILGSNGSDIDLKNIDDIKNKLLHGNEAYVLLNFDKSQIAKKSEIGADYAPDGYPETINTDSDSDNPSILFTFTRSQFLTLCLKDYKITAKNSQGQDTQYFTMSNSVCLKENSTTIFRNFNIASDNVFKTEEDAKKNPAIKVWVERVAVKYSVDFSQLTTSLNNSPLTEPETNVAKTKDDPSYLFKIYPSTLIKLFDPTTSDGGLRITEDSYEIVSNDKKWQINVYGYGVNALEKYSYLLKYFDNTKTYYTNWNDYDNYRCYWAEDLHYLVNAKDNYPLQFRRALEVSGNSSVPSLHKTSDNSGYTDIISGSSWKNIDVESKNDAPLDYFPFNHFIGKQGNFYSLENTYYDENGNILGDRGFYSAGTHLIMIAQLFIDGTTQGQDLYKCQNDIFYQSEEEIIKAKIDILDKVILKEGNHGIRVLKTNWSAHTSINEYYDIVSWEKNSYLWIKTGNNPSRKAEAKDFTLIPAEISGGDGQLLIAPSDLNATYYLAPSIVDGDGKDTEIMDNSSSDKVTEISADLIISLIHKIIGAVDHYHNGYMYYCTPIPHAVDKVKNDSYKTLGDIGAVRNNWYDIQITSINGVGRPIDREDQPLIPNLDVNRSYLNATVRLRKWHEIDQNITESQSPM